MPIVYTIGHGNRSIEDLVATLAAAGVGRLVDVRAYPRSRRHPHFGYGPIGASLAAARIGYDWWGKALGGMRRGADEARHPGLREPALRAYAAYMQSVLFRRAAEEGMAQAERETLCLMCAERDPAQCHRSLISDWIVLHGGRVIHLMGSDDMREHSPHPSLRFDRGVLRYTVGAAQGELF
jgi:uncharacterized protein (DUF488 family)